MMNLSRIGALMVAIAVPALACAGRRPGEDEYQKAIALIRVQNYWEARTWLEFASKDGHPEAQYELARQLMGYDGGAAKPVEALKWAKRSAAGGHAPAAKLIQEIEHPAPKPVAQPYRPPVQWKPPPAPTAAAVVPPAPVQPVPQPFLGKSTPAGRFACKICNGRGIYSKHSTWTEWQGGWGNNPYAVEVTKSGMAEFQCKACSGRGYN